MKKGQIYEGIIERVDFPNKGMIYIPEEEKYVTVKNGIPGQKVRFMINTVSYTHLTLPTICSV